MNIQRNLTTTGKRIRNLEYGDVFMFDINEKNDVYMLVNSHLQLDSKDCLVVSLTDGKEQTISDGCDIFEIEYDFIVKGKKHL